MMIKKRNAKNSMIIVIAIMADLYLEQCDIAVPGSIVSIGGVLRADKWNPTANQAKLTMAPIRLPNVKGRLPILSTR